MSDTYAIKALEWFAAENMKSFTADSALAAFTVIDLGQYDEPVECERWHFQYYVSEGDADSIPCDSPEAGKARAEAWYLKRLLPALVKVEGGKQ